VLRVRRRQEELRVEITPMIDVVFLLLTFFIYSMVLLVRVDLLPMDLRTFTAGAPARPAPAATLSIDLDGNLFLDRAAIELDEVIAAVEARRQHEPATMLYLAIADGAGSVDRAPLLQDLWDRLKGANIPINLVGRPGGEPPAAP
jgi:biopolymer transport protein ExbD